MSVSIRRCWLLVLLAGLVGLAGVPSAIAAAVPVGLQTNPAVDEFHPAATATYEAWQQNSVSNPGTWNVYAVPRAGGASWKVNAPRTRGYNPSPVTGGNDTIIYQQAARSSNLFIYNLATRTRTALPAKVDTTAWEYDGVASTKYVAFMRVSSKARVLLLFNRSSGRVTQIGSAKLSCDFCLGPTWVGTTHLAYEVCSPTTYACNAKVLTIGGSTVTVPRAPAPHSVYGAAMDESTGDVYFVSSTIYCGLFVSIERWNLSGGAASDLYDLPEAFDVDGLITLGPDVGTPGNLDALYTQFDCLAQNDDTYELQSANTLLKSASRSSTAAVTGTGLVRRAPHIFGAG